MATLAAAAEGSGQLCSFSLPQSTHTCRVTRTNVKCSTGLHTMGQIGRLRIWQNLTKSDRMRSGGEQNGRMTDTTRAHTHTSLEHSALSRGCLLVSFPQGLWDWCGILGLRDRNIWDRECSFVPSRCEYCVVVSSHVLAVGERAPFCPLCTEERQSQFRQAKLLPPSLSF